VQEAYAEEREVQEMTPRSEEVQEADDEEWGSANATGGETGECKNASERGKWGHPSSRHLRAPQRTRPDYPARWQTHSPRAPVRAANALGSSWSIRGSQGAARTGRVGYARSPQSRTEQLEIIHCKLTKNLTAFT
jgi:hypothetical protein